MVFLLWRTDFLSSDPFRITNPFGFGTEERFDTGRRCNRANTHEDIDPSAAQPIFGSAADYRRSRSDAAWPDASGDQRHQAGRTFLFVREQL